MSNDVYALLIDKRVSELNGKSVENTLSRSEQAELQILQAHRDKAPAVTHRIRILTANLFQNSHWGLLWRRFSRKFRQNMAELEALLQYGHSKAVWEIAYLTRKQVAGRLPLMEASELHYLTLYHDSPAVLRITQLKLKEEFGRLNTEEALELADLQQNPYRQGGIPDHLLEMFWPEEEPSPQVLDFRRPR